MQKGFKVVNTREGFEKLAPGSGKTLVIIAEDCR